MEHEDADLLRKTYELGKDNNRMLRAMRRSAFLGGIFKALIWAVTLLLPLYLYMTYIAPTLNQAMGTLNQVQGQMQKVQDAGAQVSVPFSQFSGMLEGLKKYLPQGSATSEQ